MKLEQLLFMKLTLFWRKCYQSKRKKNNHYAAKGTFVLKLFVCGTLEIKNASTCGET